MGDNFGDFLSAFILLLVLVVLLLGHMLDGVEDF
jgi:hypothetical protein